MRIGYPCINNSIGCTTNKTFRLASYSEARLIETVSANLNCLKNTLEWNRERGLDFFRISSQTVPFASHAVCQFDWRTHFSKELTDIGAFIRAGSTRISMHPDQFVLINAIDERIVKASVAELVYHAELLEAMELDSTAKIQIHVGGVYSDKAAAMARFVKAYNELPSGVRARLVVENDDRLYTLADVLSLSKQTGVPLLFDTFHHACLNNGESLPAALAAAAATWKRKDGPPMIDYSSQAAGARLGKHADSLDVTDFRNFLVASGGMPLDVMLEIRDKEASALTALAELRKIDAHV